MIVRYRPQFRSLLYGCPALGLLVLAVGISVASAQQASEKSVKELARDLAGRDAAARRDAVYELASRGAQAEEAVPQLIEALKDSEQQIWFQAVTAISRIGPPAKDAVPVLIDGLKGRRAGNEQFFYRFTHALGMIGEAAVPALMEALQDENSRMRAAAAKSLGWMGPEAERARVPLIAALDDGDDEVRAEAATALALIGDRAWEPLKHVVETGSPRARIAAVDAIGQLGPAGESGCETVLKKVSVSDDEAFKAAAIQAGIRTDCRSPEYVRFLLDSLMSEGDELREGGINGLLALKRHPELVLPGLGDLLEREEPVARERSAYVIGRMGAGAAFALPRLIDGVVRAKSDDRRTIYINAIVNIGSPAFVPLVTLLIGEPLGSIGGSDDWVIDSLARIGPRVVEDLRFGLGSELEEIRLAAVLAIGRIGRDAANCERELGDATTDPVPEVRSAALLALSKIGTSNKILVGYLESGLSDPEPVVRIAAANAMIPLGPAAKSLVPVLIDTVEDTEDAVQLGSIQALGAIGPAAEPAVPKLVELLRKGATAHRGEIVRSLGRIGPGAAPAVSVLMDILENDRTEVRPAAFIALASIGSGGEVLLERIREGLDDESPEVRVAALRAVSDLRVSDDELLRHATKALSDGASGVRLEAADIVGSLGKEGRPASSLLFAMLDRSEEREEGLNNLRRIDANDISLLAKAADNAEPGVRVYVCEALSKHGKDNDEAMRTIRRLMRDDYDFVRSQARRVLRNWERGR